jgi:deoxyadenosine/deoxycytidine kinase
MSKNPIIISIDGNIGAGKSTFLNQLKKQYPKWNFIDEPVDVWSKFINEEGESLLEVFYKDRKRWSYTFQNCAFMTRVRVLTNKIKEWRIKCQEDPSNFENNIFITERSVATDYNVFAKMLYEDGSIDKLEWDMYKDWYDFLYVDCKISGVIYITCPPEKCFKRINIRHRPGEEAIPLEYLTKLHNSHENWINGIDSPVIKVDTEFQDFTKDNVNEIFETFEENLIKFKFLF